jgi:hypothetical protein
LKIQTFNIKTDKTPSKYSPVKQISLRDPAKLFQQRADREQRPASKRGMPESSVTRQHVPENTLRSKL